MHLWCRCFRHDVYCVITLVSTGTHNQSQLPFKGFPLTHQDSRLDKKLWWYKKNQLRKNGHCIRYTKVISLNRYEIWWLYNEKFDFAGFGYPLKLVVAVVSAAASIYEVYSIIVMATNVFIVFLSFSSHCLQFICCLVWHKVLTLSWVHCKTLVASISSPMTQTAQTSSQLWLITED